MIAYSEVGAREREGYLSSGHEKGVLGGLCAVPGRNKRRRNYKLSLLDVSKPRIDVIYIQARWVIFSNERMSS